MLSDFLTKLSLSSSLNGSLTSRVVVLTMLSVFSIVLSTAEVLGGGGASKSDILSSWREGSLNLVGVESLKPD